MSGRYRLCITDAEGLAPYVEGLRRLEASIDYPIADGAARFVIDHGPAYHPFFSKLGEPRFVVATDRAGDVVGVLGGVLRTAMLGGSRTPSAYLCDLKLARSARRTGLAARMFGRAIAAMLQDRALRRWRIAYAAAMRGARGDVTASVRGLHPGRLARPIARLHVYFAEPAALARLPTRGAPSAVDPLEGFDLSAGARVAPTGLVTTRGDKDLRIVGTGVPFPLVHLPRGPGALWSDFSGGLRAAGELVLSGVQVDEAGPAPDHAKVCFALDERQHGFTRYLGDADIHPGATCTVYALTLPGTPRRAAWVHLATSEI